ncbi:MAG: methyl-accepting chemotaxis protein [Desulfobulbus sp.]|nr:methyl-accepting chemotaxis protein [Desulfobulbus sp.]
MNNVKLATKIGGGFAFILILLLIVAGFSWRGLNQASTGITEYDRKASNSTMVAEIQEFMLEVRLQVKEYMINHNESSRQQYQGFMSKLQASLNDAKMRIINPERAAKIAKIAQEIDSYQSAFEQLIIDIQESDRIVNNVLRNLGPSMQTTLAEIITSATQDDDAGMVAKAATANQHMLLARLYAQRFLATVAANDAELVANENSQLQQILAQIIADNDPVQKERAQKILSDAKTYIEAFNNMAKAAIGRNEVYNETLSKIGQDIAEMVSLIRATYVSDQHELGNALKEASQTAIRTMLIIASIALLVGIAFALLLTRAITNPVRKTAAFAQSMANGDFTTKLDVNQSDEIGVMASSLNLMVGQLGSMIKEIVAGISSLSMSSTDLAAVSRQLSSAAKDTADKSGSVAAASEEMSTNFQSVSAAMEQSTSNVNMIASSTEEMTATVNEIAESAEKARTITDKAVKQSKATTSKMTELGESAIKIGRVTETITEISEQTNLLALNATIEAARAGEAGKGFAVVANEIKELARQTAEATVDIKNQISEMQSTTSLTIEDIGKISEVILEINTVINAIATAVEEQSAATNEISGNIAQASMGIAEVNENVAQSSVVVGDITRDVSEISLQSTQVNDGSNQVQVSAQALSDLADQLEAMVRKFKV